MERHAGLWKRLKVSALSLQIVKGSGEAALRKLHLVRRLVLELKPGHDADDNDLTEASFAWTNVNADKEGLAGPRGFALSVVELPDA